MAKNKNHKFEVRLSMDDNVIASRARWVEEYPESIIYSLRLNKLLNDMCDLVEEALREKDIERAWGVLQGFDRHLHKTRQQNKNKRRENRARREGDRNIDKSERITK